VIPVKTLLSLLAAAAAPLLPCQSRTPEITSGPFEAAPLDPTFARLVLVLAGAGAPGTTSWAPDAEVPFLLRWVGLLAGSQLAVDPPGALAPGDPAESASGPSLYFDDPFDGAGLDAGWRIHNPGLLQLAVANGELLLRPTAGGPSATWFAAGEGPMVYRLVSGDFTATAAVRSNRITNPNLPPPANFDMGGLCARDPRSDVGPHDWLHVAVGGGVPQNPIVVEDKTTDDSVSDLRLHSIAAPRGQVRIARRGAMIHLLYREGSGAPWTLLRSHSRPDLGPALQVGPHVFSWSPNVDVQAHFDWITITR
jgi:hypothetical protein